MLMSRGALLRRATVVAITGAVCLSLGACSGDSDVAPEPAPTLASPTTTPTPSPAKPVMPAAVKVKNQAGAEAAFRYWLETYTYGFATGDANPLTSMSTPECKFCTGVIEDVWDSQTDGEYYVGGRNEVVALASHSFEGTDSYIVVATIDQQRAVLVDKNGKPKATDEKFAGISLRAKLLWVVDQWRVDKAAETEK